MRRDYFPLTTRLDGAEEAQERAPPTLVVEYEGPSGSLTPRLERGDGHLTADEVDVAYRYHPGDGTGVCSVTDRFTGEFVLEVNAESSTIEELVDAARDVPGETCYRVRIERPDEPDVVWDKQALLVYDAEGNLVRDRSLIPSGVEL